jgi:hypothetical protein
VSLLLLLLLLLLLQPIMVREWYHKLPAWKKR